MIDAYEIGLELAFSDGASAGVAALAEQLAALDAAAAAAAAGGADMLKATGAAETAVAAVRDGQARVPAPRTMDEVRSALQDGDVAAATDRVGGEEAPAAPSSAGVERRPLERDLAPRNMGFEAGESGRAALAPAWDVSADVAAVAPTAAQARGSGESETAGAGLQAVRATVRQMAAATPAEQAAQASAPGALGEFDGRSRGEPRRFGASGHGANAPERASVRAAFDGLQADVAQAGLVGPSTSDAPARAASFAEEDGQGGGAAMAEREQRASAPAGALFSEQAAAPQRESEGRTDGGGGIVTLDGRLVGQWLSERMAQDATRPGAGTTFFDARQAPAWTPSGIL